MRHTPAVAQASQSLPIPRGWIVLGAGLMSWLFVAALWTGTSQLFSYVSASL